MPVAKRKRVITDRRRQQNKDAQKHYRAKVRSKLQQLENLQDVTSLNGGLNTESCPHVTPRKNSEDLVTQSSRETVLASSYEGPTQCASTSPYTPLFHEVDSISGQALSLRPYTSDPRLNHLSEPHISIISAAIENSVSLGMTRAEALSIGFQSPFCIPALATGNNRLFSTSRDSIPQDLRPTALQVSTPHQAWLDSIPVPSLRDGALIYLAAGRVQNPDFDLAELGDDIDRGGLICWGGVGPGSCATGTPWDSRSWEARPWFLVKWRDVTGGLEGELGRLSMWWWRLKGEKL